MAFKIDSEWIEVEPDVRPEFDATYGRLGININDAWATEFEAQNGVRADRVEVPAYPLAEWVAENWWALLYEPEKSSNSRREPAFKSRHWFGTAREGFSLPDLWMISAGGQQIEVDSHPYFFQHARLVMPQDIRAKFGADEMAAFLDEFVASVIARLSEKSIENTLLQQIWTAFKDLNTEEVRFCRLLGALGMSPYSFDQNIEDLLSKVLQDASEQVTEDFCDAAEQGDIFEAADDMLRSLNDLSSEPRLDVGSLFDAKHFVSGTPWRTGVAAVGALRDHFGIAASDPTGGSIFFEKIGAAETIGNRQGYRDIEEPVVHGSLRRENKSLQISLIRRREEARRFDAARSCLLAWDQSDGGDRLVTRARVRDQQASRAFAAELLAPISYIKSRVANNLLSVYRANEIAAELTVSPAVVMWQAENNHIEVVGGRRMQRT